MSAHLQNSYRRSSALGRALLRRSNKNACRSMSTFPRRPYTFHIGASWAGKPTSGNEMKKIPFPGDSPIGIWRDQMLSRTVPRAIPNEATKWAPDAGEDFFYITEVYFFSRLDEKFLCKSPIEMNLRVADLYSFKGVSFGVADGVGGWVESGVDPSLFSQAFMYHAHRYSRNAWAGEPEIDPTLDYAEREEIEGWELTPLESMALSYHGVLREKHVQAGSSTACLIHMNASSGLLRAANLGDSGFMVVRSSSVIHKQRVQTHYFNCPKQLTKLPTNSTRRFKRACVDSPGEADTYETTLRDGDIVVAYTDGLGDNVFPDEIATITSLVGRAGLPEDVQVQAMADRMANYARLCMLNKGRRSPFESEAARQGMFFQGGVSFL
ncbi:phosphatase 2C-like domain-containing protein [Armillaria fumosa]|nr:phosphatase 2C-like domain-containing protein [Armillaria fumosa]